MRKLKMKQTAVVFACAAAVAICCSACGQANGDNDAGNVKLPPPEAAAFWNYVTKTDSYQGWSLYPGREAGLVAASQRGLTPGRNPHGAYMKLFGNQVAINAAKEAHEHSMPNGAILIQENYDKDKKSLLSTMIMYKVNGYNPVEGDWFWAMYGLDGKAAESGKVQSCIECHRIRKDHDFRFVGAMSHHHK